MKFNINSKEILALHNLLHKYHINAEFDELGEGPVSDDNICLKQVYDRLRTMIIAHLSNNDKDKDAKSEFTGKFEKWQNRQNNIIAEQKNELQKIVNDSFSASNKAVVENILTDNDDEVPSDVGYPRKRTIPKMPGFNKKRRK